MSKRLTSTIMLFLIGIGFGIFSIYSLSVATTWENRILALIYMGVAVVALIALLRLPSRQES
jgi:multisubunit Na+/H+ antiporter MnhF subunit